MASEIAEDWTITESGTKETTHGTEVYLVKEDSLGERQYHSFPMETLEWRAAEYGIDPTDFDTLIDVIAHEPYLDDPSDPAAVLADPATARGFVSPAVEPRAGIAPLELVPTTLLNAESVELARGAHLERIAHVKQTRARVTRGKAKAKGKTADPCAPVAAAWAEFMDRGEIDAKRAIVDRTRRKAAASARRRADRGETGLPKRARTPRTPMETP
ncbi:hypothetical protein [Streptomyces sp. NPDC006784]|uniref:hypothetical protein n=1 Tax=Streptomyces sp. NPDC006784 TaxID=3364764 RepID=UPI0036B87C5A